MEVLIVAATAEEIRPTMDHLRTHWIESEHGRFSKGTVTVSSLVTDPGIMRMVFALTNVLTRGLPDLCINAGIGGSFPGKFDIGDVVHVTSEACADLGAEDADGRFLSMQEMGLKEDLDSQQLANPSAGTYAFLPQATGITVNTTSGTQKRIEELINRYDPDTESMEGAAFFYTCLKFGVNFVQLRGISNVVEPRDKSKWQIGLAIERLNAQLQQMLSLLAA